MPPEYPPFEHWFHPDDEQYVDPADEVTPPTDWPDGVPFPPSGWPEGIDPNDWDQGPPGWYRFTDPNGEPFYYNPGPPPAYQYGIPPNEDPSVPPWGV